MPKFKVEVTEGTIITYEVEVSEDSLKLDLSLKEIIENTLECIEGFNGNFRHLYSKNGICGVSKIEEITLMRVLSPDPPINSFSGDNRWLSNFWYADFNIDGIIYATVEHAYQAAKGANPVEKAAIIYCKTPYDAKKLGSKVKLIDNWNSKKVNIMEELVCAKFIQNDDLAKKLIATGQRQLIEGNHWNDTFWGVCRGKGENHLGKILMQVRKKLSS